MVLKGEGTAEGYEVNISNEGNTLTRASSFSLDDGNLHVFDLDTHQKKVDFSHNYVLQVVSVVTYTLN